MRTWTWVAWTILVTLLIAVGVRSSRTNSPPPAGHAAFLPNPKLTPGATLSVDLATLCTPGYTRTVRNVPAKIKRAVFAAYGIKNPKQGEYEIDHLVSLELGGSNSIKNLWPESYDTMPFNAHVKDRYEDWLHAEVCAGRITLPDAQGRISHDWITHFQKDLGQP